MSQKPKGPGTIINDENVEYLFYVYVYVSRKEQHKAVPFGLRKRRGKINILRFHHL